jgi:hypothetical protein
MEWGVTRQIGRKNIMFRNRNRRIDPLDEDHMPLLAMWFQIRTVIAELFVPLLAGLKTLWLLIFAPQKFFDTFFFKSRRLDALHSPFGFLWRSLTPEAQMPLGPAQFLLFAIFTAALAGFGFDNSNQLSGLLTELNVTNLVLEQVSEQSEGLAEIIQRIQDFFASPLVMTAENFLDQEIISAVIELMLTLVIMVLFAYSFYLFSGRRLSPTRSYAFWLYMTGLQFFTTAVTFLLFSLARFLLPEETQLPDILFWATESGLQIWWFYLFPVLILPRLFPGLTRVRVVAASLLSHAILSGLGWIITSGIFIAITLVGGMMG